VAGGGSLSGIRALKPHPEHRQGGQKQADIQAAVAGH
jgi:hypothetical protein